MPPWQVLGDARDAAACPKSSRSQFGFPVMPLLRRIRQVKILAKESYDNRCALGA